MAANTVPIYPVTPKIGFGKVITGNSVLDGTGTAVRIYTAGSNGSRIDAINFWHMGTDTATAVRLFINNGSTQGTASNNALWFETTMASNTISQVAASTPICVVPSLTQPFLPLVLPAGYTIYATVGTTVAAGIMVTIQGGDF